MADRAPNPARIDPDPCGQALRAAAGSALAFAEPHTSAGQKQDL